LGSRACCHGEDDHERTQPNEDDISKFRLRSSKTGIANVAVQPARFGNPAGNHARLHNCQRRNKAETYCRTLLSVHSTNKKGKHASTNCQWDNGHREGHTLPHDEPAEIDLHPPLPDTAAFPGFPQLIFIAKD